MPPRPSWPSAWRRSTAEAGPRVAVGISPHAPYTVGPGLWRALAAHPDLADRPWASHLAESPAERRLLESGDGPLAELFARMGFAPGRWPGPAGASPTARLAEAGALRPGLVVGPRRAARPRRPGACWPRPATAVAHCPTSNAYLECGAGAAGRPGRGRREDRPRHRQPGVGRRLRPARRGPGLRAGARRVAAGRAVARGAGAHGDPGRGRGARHGGRDRQPGAGQAGRPGGAAAGAGRRGRRPAPGRARPLHGGRGGAGRRRAAALARRAGA